MADEREALDVSLIESPEKYGHRYDQAEYETKQSDECALEVGHWTWLYCLGLG
jgi:hypothetical protein